MLLFRSNYQARLTRNGLGIKLCFAAQQSVAADARFILENPELLRWRGNAKFWMSIFVASPGADGDLADYAKAIHDRISLTEIVLQ
jgi:hypothetical protein